MDEDIFINDSIYGQIELSYVCKLIIDTPEFQRLRFIKQLGNCNFVYPGATHTRFEHSIGTCHLSKLLCKKLQKQINLMISEEDVLCVSVAGLCHDLGHGPFSHLFEDILKELHIKSTHEEMSLKVLDFLIEKNNLKDKHKFFSDRNINFIKQLIFPFESSDQLEEKRRRLFFYQIVNNKINGIDVDKWDYFQRDSHHVGVKNSFDYRILINSAKVINNEIHFRNKDAESIYEMFHCRYWLGKRIYFHKTIMIIDFMVLQAIKNTWLSSEIKEIFKAEDMPKFLSLTDDILWNIHKTENQQISTSKKWIERIFRRDLLKIIFTFRIHSFCADKILEKINSLLKSVNGSYYIIERKLNYGMKDNNPVDSCKFYNKTNSQASHNLSASEISLFIPKTFQDIEYLVVGEPDQEISNELRTELFSIKELKFGASSPHKRNSDNNISSRIKIIKKI